jgi:hypothetical protein|tara:strand:- start:3969 stop:4670 length:702 start_codon:yes stop_codon:yes gene_type:complete
MAWWIPLAMAAGGYVIDKQMGGDGTKGALLGLGGGAMLPAAPALTSGTAAATTAGTLGPTGATMTGFAGAGGSGLLGGTTTAANLGGGYASGSLGGMTGFSPTVPTVLPNAAPVAATGSYPSSLTNSKGVPTNLKPLDKLAEYSLPNLFTQGKDFVVDGFSDMSFADQLGVGMQAQGLLNRPTQRMEAPRPGMAQRKETVFAPPLNSQIQNTQMPTEEEKLRSQYLNRPNFYG